MPEEKPAPPPKQKFTIQAGVYVPYDGDKTTEAKVKAWLNRQLKDCPFGEFKIWDVIEHCN